MIDLKCRNQLMPPTRVRVYRNLHKKCFSVVDMKTGRVCAHLQSVVLRDAEFRVRESGRQRVLKEKRKNVHAFVVGDLYMTDFGFPDRAPHFAFYNPYKTKTFININSKRPVTKAACVLLRENSILYWR